MVFCPSCSEQQEDVTKFCRFCGDRLPGANLMLKLRNEALALASVKSGRNITDAQSETAETLSNLNQNGNAGSTYKEVNNGVHRQAAQRTTHSLKNLMRD